MGFYPWQGTSKLNKMMSIKEQGNKRLVLAIPLILTVLFAQAQEFKWQKVSPESQGFSSQKLNRMLDTLRKHRTQSLLVIRDDKIVMEWNAKDWPASKRHGTASLAKALVGGMSLLVALNDGRIKPDDLACTYIPQWKGYPLKSKITIRQLASHTSGLDDSEMSGSKDGAGGNIPHMKMPGWKGDFWRQDPDPFTLSRDSAKVLFKPGTQYQYSNPGMGMVGYAVTASYSGTKYKDIRQLLWERIYKPIGIKPDEWSVGYGKTFHVSGLDLVADWGGAAFTPRATARIGLLMLHKGNWEGKQIIDSTWVERETAYTGAHLPPRDPKQPAPASTMCWYSNFDGVWPEAPRDTYLGAGANNQVLIVIPSLHIILVRYGRDMYDPGKGEGFYYGIEKYLVRMAMDALIQPPYPRSAAIKGVRFSPVSTIVRAARGSDNWPITWADDNNMYTAYGDGKGFEPYTDKKLSLGLAKILGDPHDFKGINIRSESGEQMGQGMKGKKASGMLMVNGTLYMLVRNANHAGEDSQLAWSDDHGKTWAYGKWRFSKSFGSPTFLNFGKNYGGARDNYVYIYSNDETSAYQTADRMVMARVPKNKIKQRGAYEFFKGLDANGDPEWTKDVQERGGVFVNPAGCFRSGISYNAGLKRYLWCQILEPSRDPRGSRFQGGFGIYEAPQPWGPWRTVFYTKDWDVGPGDTSCFPTKWMSSDGKTCYLLFSGDDCFSVRKAVFETNS
jgi:CubicO group peptidase (beta-lactamase class C family)